MVWFSCIIAFRALRDVTWIGDRLSEITDTAAAHREDRDRAFDHLFRCGDSRVQAWRIREDLLPASIVLFHATRVGPAGDGRSVVPANSRSDLRLGALSAAGRIVRSAAG